MQSEYVSRNTVVNGARFAAKELIREPVKEAVREALREEIRVEESGATADERTMANRLSESETSGSSSLFRTGVAVGILLGAVYLVQRKRGASGSVQQQLSETVSSGSAGESGPEMDESAQDEQGGTDASEAR